MPKSKYGNKKCRGFDSRKEAMRYDELEMMQLRGIISDLKCQTEFELIPTLRINGKLFARKTVYKADFTYYQDGELVVEDVKSEYTRKLPVYKIKKKLMYWIHGIVVREII